MERLKSKYVLVPVCQEQLGGMPTPRTGERLEGGSGADVLDGKIRIIAPENGQDVTQYHVDGARYVLEIAQIVGRSEGTVRSHMHHALAGIRRYLEPRMQS